LKLAFPCLGKKIETGIFNERFTVGGTECQCHVEFLYKCEILMLGKCVSFIASCTLCIAEVESVEAEGVIRLTGGRPQGRQPSWTTGDELGIIRGRRRFSIFEELIDFCGVTVASCIFYVANGRKINSQSGHILTKIIIFCFK
jgi:hypothetical protein